MWDLPRSGIEPVSPALAEGFFTPEPWGKSHYVFLRALLRYNSQTMQFTHLKWFSGFKYSHRYVQSSSESIWEQFHHLKKKPSTPHPPYFHPQLCHRSTFCLYGDLVLSHPSGSGGGTLLHLNSFKSTLTQPSPGTFTCHMLFPWVIMEQQQVNGWMWHQNNSIS